MIAATGVLHGDSLLESRGLLTCSGAFAMAPGGEQEVVNPSERQIRGFLASVGVGCFALLLTLEVRTEPDEISLVDLVTDAVTLLLTLGAAVGVALLAQRIQAQHEEKAALIRDLTIARAEGNGWRAKVRSHLAGLQAGMDKQFEEWSMTVAEREVGLLILKGLSHKEIASLRATTEATVRQQAQAIYRKANLPGKTAFSAYFLEDLFAPEVAIDGYSTSPSEEASGARSAPRQGIPVGRAASEPISSSA
jgi:DNA-binding CsgD family transcriptional regulator